MKIALVSLLFCSVAFAQRTQPFSLEELVFTAERGPQVDCFDPEQTPACGDITKQYCDNLRRNNGVLNDGSGNINVGMSHRSQMSELERAGLADLVRALPNLPADVQREVARPVAELQRLLQAETDSPEWYRNVSRVRARFADKINDVAGRRARVSLRQRLPRGQRATRADEVAERSRQERLIMADVTRIKMETSPNWPRLQTVLGKVKEDLLAVVNSMPLTDAEKSERIQRINNTRLAPPFGVRLGGRIGQVIEQDCRTNMVNAMYMDLTGTLTVCAGFVNGYQSESALYFTLAHELAHSFNLKALQDQNSQPRYKRLHDRLAETNGNMNCEEYRRVSAEESARPADNACGRPEYSAFVKCLNGNTEEPVSASMQSQVMQALGSINVCSITDRNQGLAFMNPDEFADRNFGRMISSITQEFTDPTPVRGRQMMFPVYFIAQERRCNPASTCEQSLSVSRERIPLLAASCLTTSSHAAENEADWYAHKALTVRLRSMTDIRQRRELVASSMGLFCGYNYMKMPSEHEMEELAAELAQIAQAESGDTHSSNEDRISAAMTEDMASLLQCTRPEGSAAPATYQGCRL